MINGFNLSVMILIELCSRVVIVSPHFICFYNDKVSHEFVAQSECVSFALIRVFESKTIKIQTLCQTFSANSTLIHPNKFSRPKIRTAPSKMAKMIFKKNMSSQN